MLPTHCQRIANVLPTHCQRVTHPLSIKNRKLLWCFTTLPTRCERVANMLTICCERIHNVLLTHCQCFANALPTRCRRFLKISIENKMQTQSRRVASVVFAIGRFWLVRLVGRKMVAATSNIRNLFRGLLMTSVQNLNQIG